MPNIKFEAAIQLRKLVDDMEREFVEQAQKKFIENLPNYLETAKVSIVANGPNARHMQLIVDNDSDFATDFNQLFGNGYPGFETKIGRYKIWVHKELREIVIRVIDEPGPHLDLYHEIIPFAKDFLPNINIYHLEKRWNNTKKTIKELEEQQDFLITTLKSLNDTYS